MATVRPRARMGTETAVGSALGAVYAVGLRLLFDADVSGYELFSRSFLYGMPIGIGALTMWLALRHGRRGRDGLLALLLAVVAFIAACMLTGLEGTICIVLLMPVLIVVPLFGALLVWAAWQALGARSRSTLPSLALLPLLAAPLEARLPIDPTPFTVSNRIVVDAPPERVWLELTHIGRIGPNELRPALVFMMGVPHPVESRLPLAGPGAMRTSVWEKGVVFRERVTRWAPGREMAYDFVIDPAAVPARAFDEHVRLGGRYYALLDGAYRLRPLPGGRTELTLSTRLSNRSRTGAYGRAWGQVVFGDFHGVLLDLVRDRAERG